MFRNLNKNELFLLFIFFMFFYLIIKKYYNKKENFNNYLNLTEPEIEKCRDVCNTWLEFIDKKRTYHWLKDGYVWNRKCINRQDPCSVPPPSRRHSVLEDLIPSVEGELTWDQYNNCKKECNDIKIAKEKYIRAIPIWNRKRGNCRLATTEDYGAGVCIYLEDKVNRDPIAAVE